MPVAHHRPVAHRAKYVVITPARNEEDHIVHTIAAMAAQSIVPLRWVIVNDGSSDGTAAIIESAAHQHEWIVVHHRLDRGFRKQGGGVIEAFMEGLQRMTDEPWEFLVKFDADLSFASDYFERCLDKFADDPQLGIGGGLICQDISGGLVCESPDDPVFHVRGATKIYRRSCWEAIGGLVQAPGWDGIDELKANMLGWKTYSFADVRLRHHRYTGSADGNWRNSVKFGLANYATGYHPLFMVAKCVRRAVQRPYLLGSVGLAWGFVKGYLTGASRTEEPQLIAYVRREQMNCLRKKGSLWDRRVSDHLCEPCVDVSQQQAAATLPRETRA